MAQKVTLSRPILWTVIVDLPPIITKGNEYKGLHENCVLLSLALWETFDANTAEQQP